MEPAESAIEAHHRLAARAGMQYGVVGARQLDELGVTDDQLHHLTTRHLVERIGPQVYRMPGTPPSWRSDLSAGLLSLGATAVVSHEAARLRSLRS